MTNPVPTALDNAPLITPERLTNDPIEALSVHPGWLRLLSFVDPDFPAADADDALVLLIGSKRRKGFIMQPVEAAILFELSRAGIAAVTIYANGHTYGALSTPGAKEDNITLRRLFQGAGAREAVKALEIASDLRPENLYTRGEGRPDKEARIVLLRHVERLASDRIDAGLWLLSLSVSDYLANLHRLFDALDNRHGDDLTD